MKVNFYATYHALTGVHTIDLDLSSGTTLQQVIHEVLKRFPVLKDHWQDTQDELYSHLLIFINGHELSTLEKGLDTPLLPEDKIDFVPPVAGG